MELMPTTPIDLSDFDQADALLIVPPFAGLEWPSLGVHLLQACAARDGFTVRVLYANLLFAREVGEDTYKAITCNYSASLELFGERFFSRPAFGVAPLGLPTDRSNAEGLRSEMRAMGMTVSLDRLCVLEDRAFHWVHALAESIANIRYPIVGSSTTFEQTTASIALLRAIKDRRRETVIILGGANCEGEMAEGLASTGAPLDHIFSGESETAFVEFLRASRDGGAGCPQILRGELRVNLDSLPPPEYGEYFEQREKWLPDSQIKPQQLQIHYESSRGCWWGEKHHCTFCGLNGLGMRFREKSPDRVIADLCHLLRNCPTKKVAFTDNIMPYHYFRTLLPRIRQCLPDIEMFYEQKANLNLQEIQLLSHAGVTRIQAGIESLSTPVLRLMDKGVTAAQNIAVLRYARSLGLKLHWNLIGGFPGDDCSDYQDILRLLPLLSHCIPPDASGTLRLDRFSPYFDHAENYGIRDIRPLAAYDTILPPESDAAKIAYYFEGEYDTAYKTDPQLKVQINEQVKRWREAWQDPRTRPVLHVRRLRPELYLLVDTRGLTDPKATHFLNPRQAKATLTSARLGNDLAEEHHWALENQFAVALDGKCVPLATAQPELIAEFEGQRRRTRTRPTQTHRLEVIGEIG